MIPGNWYIIINIHIFLSHMIDFIFRLQTGPQNWLIFFYSLIMLLGISGNVALLVAFLTNKVNLTVCKYKFGSCTNRLTNKHNCMSKQLHNTLLKALCLEGINEFP